VKHYRILMREYALEEDSNVKVHVARIGLKGGYSLVTAYVINKRPTAENSVESIMFQVKLSAYAPDHSNVFLAEHICRKVLAEDEFYFEQRPILGRGRGCAATWEKPIDGASNRISSDFIPQYEFPGVSAVLKGFDSAFLSMRFLGMKAKKEEIIGRLNTLANAYADWIEDQLRKDKKMQDPAFAEKIGNSVISKCETALSRIREGINLLNDDETSFEAFCFMNRAMILQRNIMNYSRKHGAGIECKFADFVDPRKPENEFGWRPFQIAFILMNLSAMVNPHHDDRDVVDLLYFPTGGGKTEAYLGLMAYSLSEYFSEMIDLLIQKSKKGVLVKFYANGLQGQQEYEKLIKHKGRFLKIYDYQKKEDRMAALHAKVISVDQQMTLITSASLSYHGQEGNIELGTLIKSKNIAKEIEDLFTKLLFAKIFKEV